MLSFPSSPRSGQSYAAPNGQIYVYDGVKWIGTSVSSGGGTTTTVTNNVENPFSFNVAADDSTQIAISNNELIKFIGAGGITTATDAEGYITITGSGGSSSSLVNGAKTLGLASTGEITLPLTASDAALFTVGTNKEFQIGFGTDGILTLNKDGVVFGSNFSIDSGNNLWTFDTYGGLTFPDGNTVTTSGNTFSIQAGTGNLLKLGDPINFWTFNHDTGILTFPGNSTYGDNILTATVGSDLAIVTDGGVGSTYQWTFGQDGSLTFPDTTVQTTAYTGYHRGDMTGSVFADDSTLLVDGTGAKIVGEIDSPKIRTTAESITLGNRAGYTNQSAFSIALGWYAGNYNQQSGSVAIGVSAGQTTQDLQSVAIGYYTGASNQGSYSVAIGTGSGGANQSSNSVAIGSSAGAQSQGNASIAIGGGAGRDNQGGLSIAIGNAAAYENQGIYAIGIGNEAGRTSQGWNAVSIGSGAGRTSQGTDAVAIGNGAGYTGQGEKSVAIGYNSANPNQGSHSVAIGPYAGTGSAQAANSIAISASSLGGFSPSTTGFFVNPLRNVNGGTFLNYNTSTYEIGYSNDLVSENDINIRVNLADSTQNVWTFGEDGSFTVANGISSFEKFEVKINGNDSTLSTFRFGEDGSIELPNRAQIRPSSTAYDAALSGWESLRAAEEESLTAAGVTAATRPYIAWNVTGENATEYLAELTRVWQIQQTYPDNGPLVWTPAISSALYSQIRTALNNVISAYPGVGNDVSISVQSSTWGTLGKSWNFGIDGNLTFPDGAKYAGQTVTMPTTNFSNTNSFVWEFSDNIAGSDKITLNWNLLASDTGTFYIGTTHSTNGKYLILDGTNQSLSYFVGGNVGAGKLKFGASTNGGAGGSDDIELSTSSTGSVRIETDNNSWAFGPDGLLSLGASSGGIHSDQTTGRIIIGDSLSSNGAPSAPSNSLSIGGDGGFVARISGYSTGIQPVWTFNEDLSMQIPGNITSSGNINIEINLADSTKRIWQFGEDGNLETPGDITALGNITGNILKIEDGVHEKSQALSSATGTVTHDCSLGHIFYHTSPSANWTANFTNLNLASGYATTVSLIIVQGGTGYYPNAVQIGGSAQTINWQGNTTPTVSTNRTDVASFSIINNSGTYVVLGQITGF